MSPTILLTGGGTGGHLTPGLAVAAELRRRDPECRIVFVGTDRPIECRMVESAQFEHHSLSVESSRLLLRRPIRFLLRNWKAWRAAGRLLTELQPSAVIGLGGFASAPLIWTASRTGIPTVLLEQNAIPGRTTRFLCRRAGCVCTSYPDQSQVWPRSVRIEQTGNPVPAEIATLCRSERTWGTDQPQTLLILGGSQGAESLNEAVVAVLTERLPEPAHWQIMHQTGAAQHEQIKARYTAAGVTAEVAPFFDDMPARYAAASLVISRAGATTLAELACAQLPAILLPYPYAADNHQLANARYFVEARGALLVEHQPEPGETAKNLQSALLSLTSNPEKRLDLSRRIRPLAHPDAVSRVVEVVESMIAQRSPGG